MNWRAFAKKLILADGEISEAEARQVKRAVLADGVVTADEATFLLELKREATFAHPEFISFLQDVLRKAVLRDGIVDASEVIWLRKLILVDHVVGNDEVAFVRKLGREAKTVCPEYVQLLKDCHEAGFTREMQD